MSASGDPVARCSCCQPHRIYTDYWATAGHPVGLLPLRSQNGRRVSAKTGSDEKGTNDVTPREMWQTSSFPGGIGCVTGAGLLWCRWGSDSEYCAIYSRRKNHNIAPESILNVHRQEKGKTVRPLAPSPIDAPRMNAYGEVICWTFTWVTCVSQPIETLSTRPPVLQVWASVWGRKFRYLPVENSTTICYATDMLPSVSLQELS